MQDERGLMTQKNRNQIMTIERSAGIYFAIQGLATAVWWLFLIFLPASRAYFQMGDSETVLLSFWLPDLLLMAAGSIVAAALCFAKSQLIAIALWFVTGAVSYAALYCLSFALRTDTGWLGVTLMLPAMLWSGVLAVALSPAKDSMFRRAKSPASDGWILTKTGVQVVIIWTLILFIIPFFIVQLEDKLGIVRFAFPFQKILASIFFIAISFVGLSGAYTMSKIGKGTPLPLDTATRLVVSGVYAFVRNPMAISGIGQGLAVGLWLGSPLVLLYALMGGFMWQIVFRPLEEADLQTKFGTDYERYCREVRCWTPRFKSYQIETTAASSNSTVSPLGKI
jgi:protein-S-isoprenylcysteine O-methyltransferase Ste14